MAVTIDPSEIRQETSSRQATVPGLRLPKRAILLGGLGGAGLIAFSVGAFSFFSTLADPRVRIPRPMPAAASMPDLKDGMPALVTSEPTGPAPRAPALNLPRPDVAERAVVPEPAADPLPIERAAVSEPQPPALRTGPTPPPIQNAATLPQMQTVTPVAPPARTAATIAPARAETVKAKPAHIPAVTASASQEPVSEPTSTATAVAPATAQPARKTAAAKPPVQKTAARKAGSAKAVADAEPAAAAEASATSEESDIPGARQFRAGVKAISGIFGGDTKDD